MYKLGPNFRIICDLIWNYMHRFYNVQNKLYLRIYNINSYINDKEIQAEGKVFYINTHNNLKNFYYLNNVCYICTPMTLHELLSCLLYTSPSPRDRTRSRMPSSA